MFNILTRLVRPCFGGGGGGGPDINALTDAQKAEQGILMDRWNTYLAKYAPRIDAAVTGNLVEDKNAEFTNASRAGVLSNINPTQIQQPNRVLANTGVIGKSLANSETSAVEQAKDYKVSQLSNAIGLLEGSKDATLQTIHDTTAKEATLAGNEAVLQMEKNSNNRNARNYALGSLGGLTTNAAAYAGYSDKLAPKKKGVI